MKVYIVTREPFPNGMAATNRIKCYAKAILSQGVDCEVIVYTRTERFCINPLNINGQGMFEGIPFRYVGGTPLRDKNVLIRKFNDWNDKRHLISLLKHELHSGDIVLGYIGVDAHFATEKLIPSIQSTGAKFVLEMCEIPFGTGKETQQTISGRQYCLTRELPLVNGIIVISEALNQLAGKHIGKEARSIKIPILVDFSKYAIPENSTQSEVPYIFHCGTLSEQKDGILGVIEAFGMASQKIDFPIHFYSTGSIDKSPHAQQIRQLINKYKLEEKISFLGYLSDEEVRNRLSYASLVIINKYPTQQNQYCFSTKLGEYMAAAKPVILTDVGEAMNWVEDGKSAFIVKTQDTLALANKIEYVMTHTDERLSVGQNAKAVCRNSFDYLAWGEEMVKYFHSL